MRKFSKYSVCKVSLVYVLPSSTPPLVTRFFRWLCSDFVPFLMTKCLVCFAELNLQWFSAKIIEGEKGFKQKKLRNVIGLTLVSSYNGIQCFRLQPLLLLQDFLIDYVRIMSLFFWQSVLFALLSWTYIAFQAKNHWSGERIQAKEAQECHWLDFSQLLLRNPVLLEVSQRNSVKEKKPRLTINCWGESICSLVNPLVDSHPPIHSDMVKTPVNKCRFSLPTSE